ncbi:MAG: SPOR domain-containing protein [Dysgonomonas sp.]
MKRLISFSGFIILCIAACLGQGSIITDLNQPKAGQGSITIYQDETIEGLIGLKSAAEGTTTPVQNDQNTGETPVKHEPTNYIQTKGYKIQVFSGNDQRRSKNEAYSKKEMIQSSFPDMEVAITFRSPVWRVRVGNFKTYEQAFQAMKELKDAFPTFGKEMQIVEAVIKLPVY